MTKKEFEALLQKFRYAVYDYATDQAVADTQEGSFYNADQSKADALEKQLMKAYDADVQEAYEEGFDEARDQFVGKT